MNSLILFMALSCPVTEKINISGLKWAPIDDKNMQVATERCQIKYSDSPCLVKFVKVREQMYRAICGEKR